MFTSLTWLHCNMYWCVSAQRMCVYYNMFATSSHSASTHYCTFIWGTSNICVWGGTASGHRVMEVSNTLHKSRFEREITRRLTGQETSIKYIELLVVKSSFSTFHVFLLLCSKSPTFCQTQIFKNGVTDPGISPKLQVNQEQSVVRMNPKWWKY